MTTLPLPPAFVTTVGGFGQLNLTLNSKYMSVVMKADTSLVLTGDVKSVMNTNFSSWISGGSLFMVELSSSNTGGTAHAFPFMPGTVQLINLLPGHDHFVTHGAFLAASSNVVITPSIQLGGVLLNQSIIYMRVSVPAGKGFVAVAGYGSIIQQTVPTNGKVYVEGGLLVAFPAAMAFETTVGKASLGATVLSDMGFYTCFTSPGIVLTQSGSVNRMARYMADKVGVPQPETLTGAVVSGVAEVAAVSILGSLLGNSSGSEGGGKSKAKANKAKAKAKK